MVSGVRDWCWLVAVVVGPLLGVKLLIDNAAVISVAGDWFGLVAAVVGLLVGVKLWVANPIEAHLDQIEVRMEARMEAYQVEINRRFDALSNVLDTTR